MNELFQSVWATQKPLVFATGIFLAATAVLAAISLFDPTEILGINRWIKPIKFTSSAAIFSGTVAVFLTLVQGYEGSKSVIGWGVIAAMTIELFLVIMQSARGTTSHFNVANPFDAGIYSVMGIVIAINTFLVLGLTILFFVSETNLSQTVLWAVRLGLIVFLLGSIEGGYMAGQTGHAIGVTDGGSGLPFVNWSTEGGDLRVAHFLGLHALQLIPLFGLAVHWLTGRSGKAILAVFLFAALYTAMFSALWIQALMGKPLISEEALKERTYE